MNARTIWALVIMAPLALATCYAIKEEIAKPFRQAAEVAEPEPVYHYGDRVEIVKGFYRKVGYPARVVGYDRGLYTVQLPYVNGQLGDELELTDDYLKPAKPEPPVSYRCPDCGMHVGRPSVDAKRLADETARKVAATAQKMLEGVEPDMSHPLNNVKPLSELPPYADVAIDEEE